MIAILLPVLLLNWNAKKLKCENAKMLMLFCENDNPKMDSGIEQTWEFAHPENQKYTGPLENFKKMLKGDSYSMLIDHLDHEVAEVYNNDKLATFEVTVLDKDKKYYKFKWQVEKYLGEGPLNNCWLTTAVSQPVSTGSSI